MLRPSTLDPSAVSWSPPPPPSPPPLLAKAERLNLELYKSELCRDWSDGRACRYGDDCAFAHGAAELQSRPRHPKYKTVYCRLYHTGKHCPYGVRCRFIHDPAEARTSEWRNWRAATPPDPAAPPCAPDPPPDPAVPRGSPEQRADRRLACFASIAHTNTLH